MVHPTYAWMFFNWYLDGWWETDNGSCLIDGSATAKDLENVLRHSLTLDHLPRIEDECADEKNIGNIVSNLRQQLVIHKIMMKP